MASVQVATSSVNTGIGWARTMQAASSRLWVAASLGSGGSPTHTHLFYSDNGGVSWTDLGTVWAFSGGVALSVYQDAASAYHLAIIIAGGNSASFPLSIRQLHANVASGVPSLAAMTASIDIDVAGSGLGVDWAYIMHAASPTNPRIWIVGEKWGSAGSTLECRAWYAPEGTSADTAGNWSFLADVTTTGVNAGNDKNGVIAYWTVGGNPRLTIISGLNSNPASFFAVTFDPSAATPVPGTAVTVGALSGTAGFDAWASEMPSLAVAAKADYLIFGRRDPNNNTWTFYKTVNGSTWGTPTGWSNLTIGRCQLCNAAPDFYCLATTTYGNSTPSQLKWAKITAASDTFGSFTNFSDTFGQIIATPRVASPSGPIYGLYLGTSASPFTVRTDNFTIAAADTTPPVVTLTAPTAASFVNTATPTFAGAAGTATGDLPTITITVYSGATATGPPVATIVGTASGASYSITSGSRLSDGQYTAVASQSDSAANVGTSAAVTFNVDTTPPNQVAAISATADSGGGGVTITATMPANADVAQYEIRRVQGNYPASDRTDGTVVVAATSTSANAAVSFDDTGLVNGSAYGYRVFVKDTHGNWNTGATVAAIPVIMPVTVGVYDVTGIFHPDGIAGTNAIIEWQPGTGAYESAVNAHFTVIAGTDNATPPTQNVTTFSSKTDVGMFKYESSPGVWTNVPTTGLLPANFGAKIRFYSNFTAARYVSMRIFED